MCGSEEGEIEGMMHRMARRYHLVAKIIRQLELLHSIMTLSLHGPMLEESDS